MFESLEVYRKSIDFTVAIFNTCGEISDRGVKDQLKRAALSIPLNIAEGNGRNTDKEKSQFYKMARGSLFECIPVLEVCLKTGQISESRHKELYELSEHVGRLINGLIRSI
jgi:four helix bundle protein